ncbi:MAG: hypothetical protein IKD74_05140 [Clostridia bacterium]|jgi:hypothetical protein|nr:hypothetical protein [Clostridia bacterium]
MNKKRLIVAIVLVIAEIIVMAFIIKLMHPRAYDPVSVGGGDPSKIPTITNTNANTNTKEEENVMKININSEKYVINVENEALMEEIYNALPETFTMNELNGNEKYYYLNSTMKNANSEAVGQVQKGDVMLFESDCLVIFYDSFETEFRYTKIGHIDNLGDIGSSNVEVSITK